MHPPNPSTHDKALAINLHPAQYGSFAEIGAGQEVARWFFHVGGAAATVARSISRGLGARRASADRPDTPGAPGA